MATIDVVIVAWRCEEMLRQCLKSLATNPPTAPMRVHVVDNASRDGTAEMVRREYPEVALTVNDSNLGFGAANNIVLRQSSADYVLILNPDTEITPGSLDALLALMDAQPEAGMCGPRLERLDGTTDHASRRAFPTPLSALGHFTGVGRRFRAGKLSAYTAPHITEGPVDAVNGAFMLIRRNALTQVGLFDEGYWMYGEDLDLCYRFVQNGWLVWYEPKVTVRHIKAGTSGRHRSLRLNYAFHYGMWKFYRDHYAYQRPRVTNIIVYGGIGLRFLLRSAYDYVAIICNQSAHATSTSRDEVVPSGAGSTSG